MATEGLKIVIGADISAVTDGMKVAAVNVEKFGDAAEKAFQEVAANVVKAAASFDVLAASEKALGRINASIDAAAEAATKAGPKFDSLGGRLPLQDFNQFKATIDKFKRDIESGFKFKINPANLIPPIPNSVPESFNKTKLGANQAANALTNVGRVAQDLPFGFVGIQNNLNPLLESFQRLRAETGSGKAALAALGQSLLGPAGLGIALSVVSSAIVIFQNGISGFNKKTKEAKDRAEDFIKTLKSVGEVAAGAAGSQAGDIAQVQALANVITNTNNAYSQRKRALEELKEVNKNYFGDLKLEESQMGTLISRVNEYTQALVAQAVLKGFTDEISRVSVEMAKQNLVLRKASENVKNLQKELDNTKESETSLTGEDRLSAKYVKAQKALKNANKELVDQFNVVGKLRENYDLLNNEIDGAVKDTLRFRDLNSPGGHKSGEDALKKQLDLLEKIRDAAKDFQGLQFDLKDIDAATDKLATLEQQVGNLKLQIAVRDAKKAGLPAAEIEKLKDAIKKDTEERLNDAFKKEALLLEFSSKLKFSQVNKAEIPQNIDSLIAKATGFDKKIPIITLHEVRLKLLGVKLTNKIEFEEQARKELNDSFNQIFSNLKIDSISSIADSIGEALAGGDLQNVFKNLFGIIATGLQQFGKALIAYGVAQKAFQIATKSLNPALAIAAGAGLIIAGAALKASLPKFAEGGIVTGPVIGQVGERFRPEVVLPLDRIPQLFKQIGGDINGGMQFIPIINNEGLFLAVKRGERSAGRKF